MTRNVNTTITLYKNEYKEKDNFKVSRIGGQRITIQYVLFEDFGAFFIRMYDEDNNHVGTISINTTTEQVMEVLKSKVSTVVSKAKENKLLADKKNIGRYVFFNDHSRVVMKKDHHQYDLEELIELSKKKEVTNA